MDNKGNATKGIIKIPKDYPNTVFKKKHCFPETQHWQLATNSYNTYQLHVFFFQEIMNLYLE
jgi:hypothetical protein